MAVPLTNLTITHIRNEVIGTGGSVPTTNITFAMLRDAATWERFDPAYLDGATSKAQITKAGQFRNYPRAIFWNTAISHNYTKNDCGSGGTGDTVTYTIAANTYSSFISQADANNQANNANIAGGQSYANANGGCTWWNDAYSQDFTRNNCGDGGVGTSVTYTVPANTHSSRISKADANAKAVTQASTSGQGHANTHGGCTWYNDSRSGNFTRNNCADGGSGSTHSYTIAANTYSSTVSKANANSQADSALASLGQANANSVGSCTWCPDNRGHWVQRNNCPSGQTGSWVDVYYTGNLCDFSSTISKQDAENKLSAWLTGTSAQAIANANGTCTICGTWLVDGSPYCSGNNWVQNQYKFCAATNETETRTITIENNSCNCVPWTNSGGTYCSGNNLVQNQTRTCSGNVENRTITIESNSSSCNTPSCDIPIVSFVKKSLSGTTWVFTFKVENPYSYPITFDIEYGLCNSSGVFCGSDVHSGTSVNSLGRYIFSILDQDVTNSCNYAGLRMRRADCISGYSPVITTFIK